ncbi:Ubiquitin-conjugating enzyme, putative [Angomonas deanei]|uniref:Ubiquitin-conjugating enzyme, putative n=1 Tax=Angomonas deanei TaxID=59799 RepID=A0A7G2C6C0_9TRYP|nr:Ubiquitin-conjugating enzyme, putative [Angomonas deanei]
MSAITIKRLGNDYKKLSESLTTKTEEVSKHIVSVALVTDDSLFVWKVTVQPPKGFYAGTKYELRFVFSERYPSAAPEVQVMTPIYNPAVSAEGQVCQAILADWRPTVPIFNMIEIVMVGLFEEFDKLDPLNEEAFKLYDECKGKKDFKAFEKKVKDVR